MYKYANGSKVTSEVWEILSLYEATLIMLGALIIFCHVNEDDIFSYVLPCNCKCFW